MTTLREAAQMALEALQESKPIDIDDPAAFYRSAHAIEALRVALAQPEQRMGNCLLTGVCATEGHRIQKARHEWQGLTDEEYESMAENHVTDYFFDTLKYAHAIEAKLKEKNT